MTNVPDFDKADCRGYIAPKTNLEICYNPIDVRANLGFLPCVIDVPALFLCCRITKQLGSISSTPLKVVGHQSGLDSDSNVLVSLQTVLGDTEVAGTAMTVTPCLFSKLDSCQWPIAA